MFRSAIGILSLLALVSSANAGSSNGVVAAMYAHEGDVVIFSAGSHQGKPACSTIGDDWAISLTHQQGRQCTQCSCLPKRRENL